MSDQTIINLCGWTTMMYPYCMVGNPDISDADYPEPSHTSTHGLYPRWLGEQPWSIVFSIFFGVKKALDSR